MRDAPRPTLRRSAAAAAVLLAAACASAPAAKPDHDPAYPGRCSFVELQAAPRPSPGRGNSPDNLGTGSIEVVATYRAGRDPDRRSVGYAARVQQERVDDLDAHLQQQPDILCEGESPAADGKTSGQETPSETAPAPESQPGPRLATDPAITGPAPD